MNPRERLLAMFLLGAVSLGGVGFLGHQFLLSPLRERDASIALLQGENERKRERVAQVLAERAKLDLWRRLSLPADADLARRDYEKYLTELLRQSGFSATSFSVTPRPVDSKTAPALPGKGPIYTRLTFNVVAQGSLNGFVEFLRRFYRTGLLHQVRNLTVQRPLTSAGPQQNTRELDVNLAIEAMVLAGAENRMTLLPTVDPRLAALDASAALRGGPGLALAAWGAVGPAGPLGRHALAEPARNYNALAARDIFFGPQAPPTVERTGDDVDVTRFVYLTDITKDDRRTEAFLYDRYNNRRTRLRASAGFDSFRFVDDQGEPIVRGQVVRIDARDVIVRVNEKLYAIHIGQSLDDALRSPLTRAETEALKLPAPPATKKEDKAEESAD